MKNFKIKVEKEDKVEFIYWVIENYKANVPKMLKGPYYFFDGNNITQSTKYYTFKYDKLPEYYWNRLLRSPIPYEGRVIMVDLKDHEIESYPSSENYSNLRKDLDQARVAAVKLNNELKQLDESIKKDPKINVGNHENKTMKKQTEYFCIDLSKVDRLEAENLIKSVGGVFDPNWKFIIGNKFINYNLLKNNFWYGDLNNQNSITSIPELKKQLGIDDKEEEKEYVLIKEIKVAVDNKTEKVYEKGYLVKKLKERWFSSANHCYFSVDNKYIVTLDYVEEKNPLLSDVVKYKDTVIDRYNNEYQFLKISENEKIGVMLWGEKNNNMCMLDIQSFNQLYKLKK